MMPGPTYHVLGGFECTHCMCPGASFDAMLQLVALYGPLQRDVN